MSPNLHERNSCPTCGASSCAASRARTCAFPLPAAFWTRRTFNPHGGDLWAHEQWATRRRDPAAPSSDLLHEAVEPRAQLTATLRKRVDGGAVRAGGRDLAPDPAEIELQTLDLEVST